jgi:Arc-like DNA binding domain
MATQDDYIRTALRVPADLHKAIHASAAAGNRTFNAEIIARLQSSFDFMANLPFAVQEAIEHEIDEHGGTAEEALIRVAKTAMANGGTLFHAIITPQTTIAQFKAMLEASKTVIPPDASIIFERKNVKVGK